MEKIQMKKIFHSFYNKPHFARRLTMVILAVIVMGFALSLLLLVDLGTDPCTMMNKAISERLGLSIGNWQAVFNIILLIAVIIFGGRNLGFGTLANMFLVGYSIDFFNMVWERVLPLEWFDILWVKAAVFIPALPIFVIAAAVYMDVDLGTAPYDAVPYIISERLPKVNFRIIRIIFDFATIGIGVLLGGSLEIVTILMALLLGPTIGIVGKRLERLL